MKDCKKCKGSDYSPEECVKCKDDYIKQLITENQELKEIKQKVIELLGTGEFGELVNLQLQLEEQKELVDLLLKSIGAYFNCNNTDGETLYKLYETILKSR